MKQLFLIRMVEYYVKDLQRFMNHYQKRFQQEQLLLINILIMDMGYGHMLNMKVLKDGYISIRMLKIHLWNLGM